MVSKQRSPRGTKKQTETSGKGPIEVIHQKYNKILIDDSDMHVEPSMSEGKKKGVKGDPSANNKMGKSVKTFPGLAKQIKVVETVDFDCEVSGFLENSNNSKAPQENQTLHDGINVGLDDEDENLFHSEEDGNASDGSDNTTDSVKIKHISEEEMLERYDNDPYLKKYIKEILGESFKKDALPKDTSAPQMENDIGLTPTKPKSPRGSVLKGNATNFIKSPSDTTLYRPALNLRLGESEVGFNVPVSNVNDRDMVDKISNFITGIRMQHEVPPEVPQPGPSRAVIDAGVVDSVQGEIENMKRKADQSVIDAERFKATIVEVPGMQILENLVNLPQEVDLGQVAMQPLINGGSAGGTPPGKSDKDFFQLMCHVEPSLHLKIENGEFVDLEKLLPKDKRSIYKPEDDRLEWVFRDGGMYLAPAGSRENRINGIRKWDQAFRVYAIIYCGAHPERSKEIWQYVDIIHTAAASLPGRM